MNSRGDVALCDLPGSAVKVWSFTRLSHWEPGCQAVTNRQPHRSPGPTGRWPRAPSTELHKRSRVIGPGPPLEGLGALHMPGTLGPTPNPAPDSGDGHRPASPLTWPPDPTASGFMEASGKRMPAFASLHNFGRSSLGLAWGEVGVLGGAPSAPLHPLPPVLACSWPHPAGVPTVGGPHGSHLGSV